MSVRATGRLIGDTEIVSAIPKSPQMVVKAFNAETNLITTSWFSNNNEYQVNRNVQYYVNSFNAP